MAEYNSPRMSQQTWSNDIFIPIVFLENVTFLFAVGVVTGITNYNHFLRSFAITSITITMFSVSELTDRCSLWCIFYKWLVIELSNFFLSKQFPSTAFYVHTPASVNIDSWRIKHEWFFWSETKTRNAIVLRILGYGRSDCRNRW